MDGCILYIYKATLLPRPYILIMEMKQYKQNKTKQNSIFKIIVQALNNYFKYTILFCVFGAGLCDVFQKQSAYTNCAQNNTRTL